MSVVNIEIYIKSHTQTYIAKEEEEEVSATNHLVYTHKLPARSEGRNKYLRMAWNGNGNRYMKFNTQFA